MCETGEYTERGIKGSHGFQAEYVVDKEEFLIPVPSEISDIGVLTEPMSVVVKAIDEAFQLQSSRMPGLERNNWLRDKKALVAGIGPIGLLAAFLLQLQGAKVFGLDIVDESSRKAQILKEIGGTYINGLQVSADIIDDRYGKMDFVLDATGIAKLEFQLLDALGTNGIYVLTGIAAGNRPLPVFSSTLMQQLVLKNQVMFGSVNASIRHYYDAVDNLVLIKRKWGDTIHQLITGRVPYTGFKDVILGDHKDDIKMLIEWHKVPGERLTEEKAAEFAGS
jgi:threonine dehydrogenase-like Zn-dependent dehydrogenase